MRSPADSFLKQFLLDELPGDAGAYFAAFGKHPGWNDHIDDLGLQTETLAMAKRIIYLDGLSSQIDSGAWEKLSEDSRLEGFDHLYLWQRGSNLLLGSITSSRDGKGRTRYPIVLCAQLGGVPLEAALHDCLPRVDLAMAACKAAATADEVRAIMDETREALVKDSQAHAKARGGRDLGSLRLLQSRMGPGDDGLLRIFYQIKTRLSNWAPGRAAAKTEVGATHGVHFRLPQGAVDPIAGLTMWSELFEAQLDSTAPRLFFWPRMGNWLDVVVGRPAGVDFFGLRANTRAIPFVTDVPYDMDRTFREEVRALLMDLEAEPPRVRSIFADSGSAGGASALTSRVVELSRSIWQRMRR